MSVEASVNVVVLVSVARHSQSGREIACAEDAAALGIALSMPSVTVHVMHAGNPESNALREYLGMGARRLTVLQLKAGTDPTERLSRAVKKLSPVLVLTGYRARSGLGSGMLPYVLARRLQMPVVVGARDVKIMSGTVGVDQALPFARIRRVSVGGPAIVSVHATAGPTRFPTYGNMRRGSIVVVESSNGAECPQLEFRAAKRRPIPLEPVRGEHYADRLLQLQGQRGSRVSRVIKNATPIDAAREIVSLLAAEDVGTVGQKQPR